MKTSTRFENESAGYAQTAPLWLPRLPSLGFVTAAISVAHFGNWRPAVAVAVGMSLTGLAWIREQSHIAPVPPGKSEDPHVVERRRAYRLTVALRSH